MASSDLSGEEYLGSLGISLDDVNLTADASTHASITGIFAQDPHIRLDVAETSMSEIPIEILDPSHPVGAIIYPSRLGYLRQFDAGRNSHKELLGALAERWLKWGLWPFAYRAGSRLILIFRGRTTCLDGG
ncbi:hypothetical protein JCGZ_26589 [Jatropha curcas]|uniref:Uncharacterized protein n=1 Tax=Jatropha curcas TaxID=180498 RepID=A0A067L4E5_JATCU|nr:hypothetical protein JCGZ_26589 [Jatropha curcas]